MDAGRVTVSRDLSVSMRDGVRLSADVYQPGRPGPHPVLVIRVPYSKEHAQTVAFAHPYWYAARGYIVVVQDTRGRYRSEGEFDPWGDEGRDGYDTVEWAASLPDSNGRVGMYGFSYAGGLQLQAAAQRPPHLCAIAPAFASLDFYGDWLYPGGALSWAFLASWCPADLAAESARRIGDAALYEQLSGTPRRLPDAYWHLPITEFPDLPPRVAPYFQDWLAHPARDEFWERLDPAVDLGSVAVPALHLGGWSDIFIEGTLNAFSTLAASGAAEQRLVVGPWMHMPWTPWIVPEREEEAGFGDIDLLQLRWFDRWLKGDDDSRDESDAASPVRVFTMGADRWTSLAAWPESNRSSPFYLHSDGRANTRFGDGALVLHRPPYEEFDTFVFDPKAPVASVGGRSCCDPGLAPIGVFDQRSVEERRDVLVYTSDALERPIEVRGAVGLVIWAASSAVDTDFTAKLVDVHPDGRALNVVDGILRARHRDGGDDAWLEADQIYRLELSLGSTNWEFVAGHRLRVEVSSSNFPRYSRNANSRIHPNEAGFGDLEIAVQRVFHGGERLSALLLPLAHVHA